MTDRPIIFSIPMVCALIDGRKTQTRRVLKKLSKDVRSGRWRLGNLYSARIFETDDDLKLSGPSCEFMPYTVGDRLWVREAWTIGYPTGADRTYSAIPWTGADPKTDGSPFYRASFYEGTDEPRMSWRPSIHMPRWASRITLIVTDVRIQRVQDINEEDAFWEGTGYVDYDGISHHAGAHPSYSIGEFRRIWNSINAKRGFGWIENPWVVALTFRVIKANIDNIGSKAELTEGAQG